MTAKTVHINPNDSTDLAEASLFVFLRHQPDEEYTNEHDGLFS
jgi:hypothetical protein